MSYFLLPLNPYVPPSIPASGNSGGAIPQEKNHSLSLLAWDNICKPKSLGGLGIRTMEATNNSLLARIGWKMTSNQPHLWVDSLRGKYLKNGVSFLAASTNAFLLGFGKAC
jgi:hypothetical protein